VGGSQQARSSIDRITGAYLNIQSQLASDSVDSVPAELKIIRDAAGALQNEADGQALKTQSAAVAKAADFRVAGSEQTRKLFVELSNSVIELVNTQSPSDQAVEQLFVAQCPMVENGRWLQTSRKVTNPYMGSQMLQCGSIENAVKGQAEQSGNQPS
jgi:Cu(I)/Ag(I) efflux system membrane fusion protein